MSKESMNLLTMTDEDLVKHASKQVQALRMALDMIECEKHDRRHVRWAIIDALKEEADQPAQQEPVAWLFTNVQSGDIEASTDPYDKQGEREYWHSASLYTSPQPAQPQQDGIDWKDQYEKQKRCAEMWVAKYEADIGPLEKAVPVTAQPQISAGPVTLELMRPWTQEELDELTAVLKTHLKPAQPVPWYESTAELATVYGEMCAINETKRDDQTPEQTARLNQLRAECVAIHKRRIMLNTSPQPVQPQQEPLQNIPSLTTVLAYLERLVPSEVYTGMIDVIEDEFQRKQQPAQRKPLTDELEALFTNIDHAISSGAWNVQKGSQTWEIIEEAKTTHGIKENT